MHQTELNMPVSIHVGQEYLHYCSKSIIKKKKLFEEEKIAFNVLSFCICPTHSIITLSNNLLKSINKKIMFCEKYI